MVCHAFYYGFTNRFERRLDVLIKEYGHYVRRNMHKTFYYWTIPTAAFKFRACESRSFRTIADPAE